MGPYEFFCDLPEIIYRWCVSCEGGETLKNTHVRTKGIEKNTFLWDAENNERSPLRLLAI